MIAHRQFMFLIVAAFLATSSVRGGELLFEDTFDKELSSKWRLLRLKKEDYRIRDGALELRVAPGKETRESPLLWVPLDFTTTDTVIASVEITPVTPFTEPGELAGLSLISNGEREFSVGKRSLDGFFVFTPGEVDFIGKDGEEGDVGKYTVKYWPADPAAGAVRIIVRGDYAHFQVGPSKDGKYANYFHSAIEPQKKGLGFGLRAVGGPAQGDHWVRFDNFRVEKP